MAGIAGGLYAALLRRAPPLLVVVVSGCAGFTPQPGPEPDPEPERAHAYAPLTRPVIFVGDTQEHEATGFPLYDNDSAVDAYVEVAQRPPEQPLFGRRILEWVLLAHPGEPTVHLGDVMDLSCRSEAERMNKVFALARQPVAVLPGNHDGLMFGIYSYPILDRILDPQAERWNRVCRRGAAYGNAEFKTGREALSKRDFITLYLDSLTRSPYRPVGLRVPSGPGEHRLGWRSPDPQALVSAIEARLVDGWRYADSFVAQRLKLPKAPQAARDVVVIALDTNQAGALVSTWDTMMGRSPGSMGHIKSDQIEVVTKWVEEAARERAIVVFAGHHNWRSLGFASQLMLRQLMSRLDHPIVYLSAHTHRGFWALHRSAGARPVLELNVSSLSDWPIAYRRISFDFDAKRKRIRVRGELLPRADRVIETSDRIDDDDDLLYAWERAACADSGFGALYLSGFDIQTVRRQRESRGGLVEWLLGRLRGDCADCERPLYDHAHGYQNQMLRVLLEVKRDLGPRVHVLHTLSLPWWCEGDDFESCARGLLAESVEGLDFAAHVDLFRRKAQLVYAVAEHLDDLRSPAARGYMTCRAVNAARADFDATSDDRNSDRGEAKRRAENFFIIEASVGMQ